MKEKELDYDVVFDTPNQILHILISDRVKVDVSLKISKAGIYVDGELKNGYENVTIETLSVIIGIAVETNESLEPLE